jgi:hypothetical protein
MGSRGARSSAQVVRPDIGISIKDGATGDSFGSHPEATEARLGDGLTLYLYAGSELQHRRLAALVKDTALHAGLPLLLDMVRQYGDGSAAIQNGNGNAPTVNLAVPVRCRHAHSGAMSRQDFDQMVDLLVALIGRLDQATVAPLRDFSPDSHSPGGKKMPIDARRRRGFGRRPRSRYGGITARKIKPVIGRTLPADNLAGAYRPMESGGYFCKIVVRLG